MTKAVDLICRWSSQHNHRKYKRSSISPEGLGTYKSSIKHGCSDKLPCGGRRQPAKPACVRTDTGQEHAPTN